LPVAEHIVRVEQPTSLPLFGMHSPTPSAELSIQKRSSIGEPQLLAGESLSLSLSDNQSLSRFPSSPH